MICMKQLTFMTLLLLACLLGACSHDDEDTMVTQGIGKETSRELSVSDITKSECLNNMTRGDGLPTATLVMKRDGNTIDCQLLDIMAQCALDFYADAEYDSEGTLVITIGDQSEISTNCVCSFNTSFHVEHAVFNQCLLRVQWDEPGWAKPYVLYEGDITISEEETMIEIRQY